jgi:hypothetical protein
MPHVCDPLPTTVRRAARVARFNSAPGGEPEALPAHV